MARVCEACGKHPTTGNKVSHSNRRTRRRWLPNLQNFTIMIDGKVVTHRLCTRCMRTFKGKLS